MSYLENRFEKNFIITSVDYVFNWARKSAIWPLTFGLACCAIEMIASSTARFDIARFGAEVFRPSPRQSDLMIVAGGGGPVQRLLGAAGRGQDRAGGRLRGRLPPAPGEPLLCVAEVAGQDRPDERGQAAHGSPLGRNHAGEFQEERYGRADAATPLRPRRPCGAAEEPPSCPST